MEGVEILYYCSIVKLNNFPRRTVAVFAHSDSRKSVDLVLSQPLPGQDKTWSTAFLGTPRKAVHLEHLILVKDLSNFHSNVFLKC